MRKALAGIGSSLALLLALLVVTPNVYRFGAIRVGGDDLRRAHGTDERLSVDALVQMVAFYLQLLTGI